MPVLRHGRWCGVRYGPNTDLREVYPARTSRPVEKLTRARAQRPPLKDITEAVREYQAGRPRLMRELLERFPDVAP